MRILGAALLATTALAVTPASATAAGETCQGKPATHAGQSGPVTGTEGDDVIVAGPAAVVKALGGNDLICIQGHSLPENAYWGVDVDAGTGDDVVDATQAPSGGADVVLGAGADTYLGANHAADVHAGTAPDWLADTPGVDTDADVVRMAAYVISGTAGLPNPDVIDRVASVTWRGTQSTSGVPVTSTGGGTLSLETAANGLRVDDTTGQAIRVGTEVLRFSGFQRFHLPPPAVGETTAFVGGDDRETVLVSSPVALGTLDIALGGSADGFYSTRPGAPGSSYDGDKGDDWIVVGSRDAQLHIDLAERRLDLGRSPGTTAEGTVRAFENAHGLARKVTLKGNKEANRLLATACTSVLDGRAGADYLSRSPDWEWESFTYKECKVRVRATGGGGHDYLQGFAGPDRLIGGKGKDTAFGRAGVDVCRAETEKKCER